MEERKVTMRKEMHILSLKRLDVSTDFVEFAFSN